MRDLPMEPLRTRATWRRAEHQAAADWRVQLSADERDEMSAALEAALHAGVTLESAVAADFALPRIDARLPQWLEVLQAGRGFLNVAGLPTEGLSVDEASLLFYGLGLHLGVPASQNAAGDLLGHVRDTGADPQRYATRLYKTPVELGFHSDGADVVGLLCLHQSREGGETRLASTAALYNEILARRPDLVPVLFEPFHFDRNDEQLEGQPRSFALPICHHDGHQLRFFYIGWYIRNAQRHPEVPRLTDEQHAVLDLIDEIAAEPEMHVDFKLAPGEVNFLKNNAVLHARSAYRDASDGAAKRHMLRLWLTAWSDADARVARGIPKKRGVASDLDDIRSAG